MDKQRVFSTLDRILESEVFISSFRAKALLNYLISKYEKGEDSDFSSYTIALEVFERDQDFDASIDPIVRVQMGRLRVLLSKYYLQEGKEEDVIINIPRGSYRPRFSENDVQQVDKSLPPTSTKEKSVFPRVYLSPLSILMGEEETASIYFKEVLFSRLMRTNFFQLTDSFDADFYISTYKSENEIGINIKDQSQHGLSTFTFPLEEDEHSISNLLVFMQSLIDGPYGLLKEYITQNKAFLWVETFISFEEIILEKGWLEYVGDLIHQLEKVLDETKNSFVASILIKYYHIDFQYNLLNFPNGLKRVDELFTQYNTGTVDFLVEDVWRNIYHAHYDKALEIFGQVTSVEGKHYETTIQELLLFAYFGDIDNFYLKKKELLKVSKQLPSICYSMEALLLFSEGKTVDDQLITVLEEHLFYFNLFLLSKLCKTKKEREKYKKTLLELVPSFDDNPKRLLSLWGHPDVYQL